MAVSFTDRELDVMLKQLETWGEAMKGVREQAARQAA